MSGVDPEIFIIFIGLLVLIACLVIVRQFLSSDKSGKYDSQALQGLSLIHI